MTTRLFLVRATWPGPGFKAAVPPCEVLEYDANDHRLRYRTIAGEVKVDPNFWPMIAKRCGFILTQDIPKEFQNA